MKKGFECLCIQESGRCKEYCTPDQKDPRCQNNLWSSDKPCDLNPDSFNCKCKRSEEGFDLDADDCKKYCDKNKDHPYCSRQSIENYTPVLSINTVQKASN